MGEAKAERASRRVPELDGIRGLAILSVLVWHLGACRAQPEPGTWLAYAAKALSFTWSGVDLFFVLSGFLIGGMTQHNFGDAEVVIVMWAVAGLIAKVHVFAAARAAPPT